MYKRLVVYLTDLSLISKLYVNDFEKQKFDFCRQAKRTKSSYYKIFTTSDIVLLRSAIIVLCLRDKILRDVMKETTMMVVWERQELLYMARLLDFDGV